MYWPNESGHFNKAQLFMFELENILDNSIKIIITTVLMCVSCLSFAARGVDSSKVEYVYQLDSDATVFEFSSSVSNGCGSTLYKVKSPNEAVANRKFSLVLIAFTTNGYLTFYDTQICEGTRSVVGWIRLIKGSVAN